MNIIYIPTTQVTSIKFAAHNCIHTYIYTVKFLSTLLKLKVFCV
jgi:hypothetical protein